MVTETFPPPPSINANLFAQMAPADDSIFDDEEDGDGDAATEPPCRPSEPEPPYSNAPPPEPEDEPELGPLRGTVTLRPYQKDARDRVLQQFREGLDSVLVISATGTGKSCIISDLAHWANERDHPVLVLAHREELIKQMCRHLARVGIHGLVEKAEQSALRGFGLLSKTVVGSVQTMQRDRLAMWPRDAFKLIVTDECHHALAPSYLTIFEHFDRAKRVGFTATADRLDGKNLGRLYQSVAFEYNLRHAVSDGWLVPIEAMPLRTEPVIDLRDLRTTAGDFNLGDLERRINECLALIISAIKKSNALEDRRTIAFTPDVSSAEALAAGLNDNGITARAISGKSRNRGEILEEFQAGKFQVLCNCQLLTEGVDLPEVSCILLCRPTKSRAVYSQAVGRGTRLHPGKENCRVVDFAYLTRDHDLVSAVDLYDDGETPDEVMTKAREKVEKAAEEGVRLDLDVAINEATDDWEAEKRERIRLRPVKVVATRFDPLAACEVYGIQQHKEGYDWQDVRPATEKQVEALRKWGIAVPDSGMGFGVAHNLLNKIFSRSRHGWASPREVALLIEQGVDSIAALGMRANDAKSYLTAHPPMATDKQVWKLRSLGVDAGEAAQLTRKQASQRIDSLMKGRVA